MSYSAIHRANERFVFAIVAVLIGAFVLAMLLMFVHPTASIFVVLLGLTVALLAGLAEVFIRRSERGAARVALKGRECPACGATIDVQAGGAHCSQCDATFLDTGVERV